MPPFLAEKVALGEPAYEPTDVMSVHRLPQTQAIHMARSGLITDGPSALALLLVADRLAPDRER